MVYLLNANRQPIEWRKIFFLFGIQGEPRKVFQIWKTLPIEQSKISI